MAITSNLQNAFVSRMTAQAAAELGQVHMLIQQTTLQEASQDTRNSPFSSGSGKIDTAAIYELLKARGQN